jgi:hypothetical protein
VADIIKTTLYCPFTEGMHPATERVQRSSIEHWSSVLGLEPDSPDYRRFCAAGFGRLIGRCHPRAGEHDLQIILDFAIWLFLWDDLCDEALSTSPERIQAMNEAAYQVMNGEAWDPSAVPEAATLLYGLAEVRSQFLLRMPLSWFIRFSHDLQDYCEACVWQAQCLACGVIPDVETYSRQRRMTSGVYPALDLVALAEQVVLPLAVRTHPTLARLNRITNNLISWANDIISLPKELEGHDRHNLVVVLQAERRCSLVDARQLAVEIHDEEMQRFLDTEREIPSFGDELDSAVARHVEGLKSWVRANLDWSFLDSERYGCVTAAT